MTSAAEYQAKVTKSEVNMDRMDQLVNGGPGTLVTTDYGSVPSMPSVIADFQTQSQEAIDNLGDLSSIVDAVAADRAIIEDAKDDTLAAASLVSTEAAKVLGIYTRYNDGTLLTTLPDGVQAQFVAKGAGDRGLFGLDNSLRWFASGFYLPPTGKFTLGADSIKHADNNYAMGVLGAGGKALFGVTKNDGVTHAQTLKVYSDLLVGGFNAYDLRNVTSAANLTRWRAKLARRLMGDTVLATWAPSGDSWTDRALYVPVAARLLQALYGDGGTGFLGFANSTGIKTRPAATDTVADTKFVISTPVGTWNWNTGYTAPTANCCELVSAASGNRLQIVSTSATVNTVFKLLYRPVAGSSVRYSWDSGVTWQSTLDLSSGYVATLANVPTTGAWTLLIEDNGASARAALTGLNLRKASGALIHKVGSPGSTSSQWAAQAVTAGFQAHWAELAPDVLSILQGTNDQTAGAAPATVGANFDTIANNVRTAVPWANEPPVDLLYMSPAENLRAIAPTMAEYATAIQTKAVSKGAAFLSLQRSMGTPAATAWWIDQLHPHQDTGGPAMGSAVYNTLKI